MFLYLFKLYGDIKRKENPLFVVGVVVSIQQRKGAHPNYVYHYFVGKESYKREFCCATYTPKFIGKKVVIVYEKNNPQNSDILLSEEDFKNYGLAFPDSLKNVKDADRLIKDDPHPK
jgi:hypothetical protein